MSYVIVDLETGGLARTCDILQISAVHDSSEFNQYITPTQNISRGESDVTKLTTVNSHLYYDGRAVDTVSKKMHYWNLLAS